MNETLVIAVAAVVFSLLWVAILLAAAQLGGWAALAEHFRSDHRPLGKPHYLCSGSFGRMNYGFCLTIGVSDDGLSLSVLPFFRVGHPPLLIPWREFHSTRVRRLLFFRWTETCVGMPVLACLSLPRWVADSIADAPTPPADEPFNDFTGDGRAPPARRTHL
ncbi:MAG: hypothetical protein KF861_01085 [Planctomycetaceae bacterium]|nr:hypothetical protein [Planctomycetaceae bacterium]